MEETKFHLTMANFLSVTLLLYYLGGFFIFLFMNSHRPYVGTETSVYGPAPDFSYTLKARRKPDPAECARINKKYSMNFDCETTPAEDLRTIPYDHLPLDEKIDQTLTAFFKMIAKVFGREFHAFRNFPLFLALCAAAPLAALGGLRLLWRLLRRMARGVRSEAPAKPYYKTVLGVFALVMLLLCAGVVISASLSRPGAVREAVPDAQVDVYGDTVRGLLN